MNPIPCYPQANTAAAGGSPYSFFNFQVATLNFNGVGTGVNSAFPTIRRLAVLSLEQEAGIVGITLSTSIINEVANSVTGLFVALSNPNTATLTLQGISTDIFLGHITRTNSTVSARQAVSRSNSISMGQNTAYKISQGRQIAIYGCSPNVAGNELTGVVTVYWVPASTIKGL